MRAGSAMLTVLAAAPGLAQVAASPNAAAQPAATAPATSGLEDIVVTARKRTESVQNVPVSVTAISAGEIDRRDLTSLERISAATPQLVIGRNVSGSGAQMTLRGIGSNSLSIGTEQSIAVIVDGVYYGQGRTINEGFFDLASVEILKGPQSLFFGKNATAGVISINTANPTDHVTAMVRGGYEFNARKPYGEGVVSGPLTDRLGFRLAVRASKDYGTLYDNTAGPITYMTRDTPTATTVAASTPHTAPGGSGGPRERDILTRGTLRWEATDRLTATIKASYGYNKTLGGAWNYNVYACQTGFSTTAPGVPCTPGFNHQMNDLPADIASATVLAKDHNYNLYNSWGTTATFDYNLDDIAITSVTNYNWNRNRWTADIDYQSSPTTNIWGAEDSRWHAFSSEVRAVSKFDSPVNFLIGGYYQNTNRTFNQVVINSNAENSAAPAGYRYVQYAKNSQTKGETLSAYGQMIWKILPKLEAAAGVRYIHETKDSTFIQPYVNPRFVGAPYVEGVPILADQTFTNWSPEATLTWKPTRDLTIYGAFKTAYKSGGFSNSSIYTINTTVPDFFTFNPEKSKGFEGGVKTMLLDRQLRFNVGLYSYKYTDLQVTYLDSAALSYNSVNAGSVRTKGVELEFEYAPRALRGFSVSGSANYNKARYGNSIAPCYGGQTPANGCFPGLLVAPVAATPTTPARAGTPGQNLAGLPTSDAPLWTATLGTRYEMAVGHALKLGFGVDSRYSASYFASPFGTPLSRQSQYVNLDASVRLRTDNDVWEVALIGKNLTNRFVVTGETDASGTGSGTGTSAGRTADQVGFGSLPRTVQIQLTWRMP
jgi:outer membrane receptor protein involved in Fe transport